MFIFSKLILFNKGVKQAMLKPISKPKCLSNSLNINNLQHKSPGQTADHNLQSTLNIYNYIIILYNLFLPNLLLCFLSFSCTLWKNNQQLLNALYVVHYHYNEQRCWVSQTNFQLVPLLILHMLFYTVVRATLITSVYFQFQTEIMHFLFL